MRTLSFAGAAAALLIAATAFALEWALRRAVRRSPLDPAAAWFGAALHTQWCVLAFWVAWAALLTGPPVRDRLNAFMATDLAGVLFLVLLVLPPLGLGAWAQLRLAEVARRVRSTEEGPLQSLKPMIRPMLALLIGLLCFGAGPALVGRGIHPIALLLGCILLALAVIAATASAAGDETPNAVTAGELRERIVAIAVKAGVKVRELYVMPQRRARMANAFAAQNNSVLITDYLLAHLGRDEVDAVLAHELAHLHRQHPQRLAFALFGAAFLPATVWVLAQSVPLAGAAFALGMIGFLAICRRCEYGADAGAIALGARPQALISGLARLARLNHVPPRWGRALEWTLTHPSLERRARAIAARGGIAPEEMPALLDASREPENPYPLPPALADGAKVFSTALKTRLQVRAGWTLLAVSVLAPAIALVLLARHAPDAPRLAAVAASLAAGIVASAGAALALSRFPHRHVRTRLAERFGTRGLAAHAQGAALVGLAPGSDARVIEGFYVWDAGFLKLSLGHLDYAGEETSFTLPAGRIRKLELVGGPPSFRPTRCVRVTWLDDAGAWCTLRLFALEPMPRGRESQALFESLDAWRRQSAAPAADPRLSFGAPRHHEVSSIAPREQVRPPLVATSTVLQLVLAAIVAGCFGLPFLPGQGPGFFEMAAGAIAGNVALMMPSLLHREPALIERSGEAPEQAA